MNKPANTYHKLIDSIGKLLQQGRQQTSYKYDKKVWTVSGQFQKSETPSHRLSWLHYYELLKIA